MIMKMKQSRRKFLKRLGAMSGAVLVPGLATEDVLAIPITTPEDATRKKVATKKKASPKKKVATKKKAAPKKKSVTYYDPSHTRHDRPDTPAPVVVAEPSTFGLVSIGVAAIALATRHKKNGQERKG